MQNKKADMDTHMLDTSSQQPTARQESTMQDGGGSIIFNYHEAPLAQDENAAWKPQLFIYLPHTHEIPVGLLVGNTLSPHSHQYS